MAVDAYRYRDPLEVLIREESRTCRGCAHVQRVAFMAGHAAQVVSHCAKGKKYGQRCKHYKDTE